MKYFDSLVWNAMRFSTGCNKQASAYDQDLFLEYFPHNVEEPFKKKQISWVWRQPKLHDEAVYNDHIRDDFGRVGSTYELRGGRLRPTEDLNGSSSTEEEISEGEWQFQICPGVKRFVGPRGWYRRRSNGQSYRQVRRTNI
jgi:hypothetical protein